MSADPITAFILAHAYGVNRAELEQLIQFDRLCPVLCRFDRGRLVCPAQDAPEIIRILEAAGWGIRDVSPTPERLDLARAEAARAARARALATLERDRKARAAEAKPNLAPLSHALTDLKAQFDPADVGGVWDGAQVISDADPGL